MRTLILVFGADVSRQGLMIAALFLVPALASAQVRGPWEVELSAGAVVGRDLNGFAGAVNVSLGYFFFNDLEVGLRQTLNYTDVDVPKTLNGSTRVGVV